VDFDTPQYEHREAARVAGMSVAALQTWANRGLLESSHPFPGQGRRRLYSLRGLIMIAMAARMADLGISASLASMISRSIAHNISNEPGNCPILAFAIQQPDGLLIQYVNDLTALMDVVQKRMTTHYISVFVHVQAVVDDVLQKLKQTENQKD
jgi:DNA-binding transcriptional MerR regulator